MIDCTLDALFEPAGEPKNVTSQHVSEGVKKATADTRARIQVVFSRQAKVPARLRRPAAV